MLICKNCGAECCDEAIFCSECGSRIDSKIACKACGMVFEGNFCPECGTPAKQEKTAVKQPRKKIDFSLKRISELASHGFMLLGILFAFIYVFFIGVAVNVDGSPLSGSKVPIRAMEIDLYYFFGKVYGELETYTPTAYVGTAQRWFQDSTYSCFQEYAIVGTIVSAGTLLVVVGLAITALTLYVLKWLNKTQKNAYGWGMAAIISFIGTAMVFKNLNGFAAYSLGTPETIVTVWSGSTTAGFVLCAVFGGLAIIAKIVAQGSAPWKRGRILRTVLSFVGIAISCVWLGAISGLDWHLRQSTFNVSVNFGFLTFGFTFLIGLDASSVQAGHMGVLKPNLNTVIALSFINACITLVLFACAVYILIMCVNNLCKEKGSGKMLTVSLVGCVLSIALYILCLVVIDALAGCAIHILAGKDFLVSSKAAQYVGNNVMFTMVMSSICLLFTIASKVLSAIRKTRGNA